MVKSTNRGVEKGQERKDEKERNISLGRKVEVELLLVLTTKIYRRNIKTLINSGATRCFVTPACIATCQLNAKSIDVFLELRNGNKFLSGRVHT